MKTLLRVLADIFTGGVLMVFNIIFFIAVLVCSYLAFDYFVIHHPVNIRTNETIYITIPDSSNIKPK